MSDRCYFDAGASGYDRGFGSVSPTFIPTLLRAAHLELGQRVLDVATGTGIAAEATARIVGPSGSILATDISTRILEQARQRLAGLTNATFAVEDGQALSIPDNSVDAVLCSMGLMLFPDPALGLSEFRRVLRENGRAAVSVSTTPERSFVARVSTEIARHVPSRAPAAARFFSLGDANHLHRLFAAAGFRAIETATETRRFPFQSFESWFDPIEKGEGNVAQEYVALPTELRRTVREELRRALEVAASPGGPIEVEVEVLFCSGQK
jgi:ubiquinone/menaquinone biosynthesis C-methylase UbiE